MKPLSIIIPCLNEEHYIPKLLGCLDQQTFRDFEVVIIDGKSADKTQVVIQQFIDDHPRTNIRLIESKKRGVSYQRNLGVEEARNDRVLFLDADIQFESTFLAEAVAELEERNLELATCNFEPLSARVDDRILFGLGNAYINLAQYLEPVSQGWCIFSTKRVHNLIGGFDESLKLSEDYDYILRAAKKRIKLKVLKNGKVYFSVRRLNEEGRLNYFKKSISAEANRVLTGSINTSDVPYEFGKFKDDTEAERYLEYKRQRDALWKRILLSLGDLDENESEAIVQIDENVSIIIPSLNEEHYLPKLLDCLAQQTYQKFEIIVVDGHSTDGTQEVVKKFISAHPNMDVSLVNSEKRGISFQRNLGSKKAKYERLLFLDADTQVKDDFLQRVLMEIKTKSASLAVVYYEPLSNRLDDRILFAFANAYMSSMQEIHPYCIGSCIFSTKSLHEELGGFDETLVMGTDQDYVIRAHKHGYKLNWLRNTKVYLSVRKKHNEGRLNYYKKMFLSDIYRLTNGTQEHPEGSELTEPSINTFDQSVDYTIVERERNLFWSKLLALLKSNNNEKSP